MRFFASLRMTGTFVSLAVGLVCGDAANQPHPITQIIVILSVTKWSEESKDLVGR